MYLVIIHPQLLLLLVAAVFCLFLRIECRLLSKRQIQGGYCAPLTVFSGQVSYLPSTGLLQSATIPSGTTAVLTCNSGYYPLGASSATCSNGIWNPALGTCQTSGLGTTNPFGVGIGTTSSSSLFGGQQCLPMLPPIGGQLSYSQGSQFGPFPAGSSVQLICSAGTVVSGSSQAFCQSGQWQPAQLGQCLSSGSLGTGTLGIGGTNGLTGGGVAPIGGCPPTIAPANGQVQYAGILQGGVYPSGTTATLFCLSGTPSNGQSTTVCRNSIWTPSLGFCTTAGTGVATISPGGFGVPNTLGLQQNSCLFGLLPPLGGTVQYSNQQQAISTTLPTGLLGSNTGSAGGPYPEGTFAILVCQQGISSGQQSICTGGQWQPPVLNGCSNTGLLGQPQTGLPGSTAGQCVLGLGVLGGNVVYSNTGTLGTSGLGTSATTSQFGPFPSGTIAQAQCLNGQFPSGGASQATCLNGQWQPSQLGQCLATGVVQANSLLPGATLSPFGTTAAFGTAGQTCIFGLLPPLNGRLQYSSAQTMGPFPAGTTASLLCNAGFVPNGQTSASCLNGQFQPTTLGQCIQSSANPTSNSANNNTSSSASTTRSSSPYSSSGGTTPAFQMWNSNNNNNGSNRQCFELPGANNGQFVYSPVGYKAPFPMGSTATLVCAEGTQMADGSTVGRSAICQSTGWSTLQFDPCLRMNASTRAAVFS